MKQRAQELVAHGDKLFGKRAPLLSLWQQMAENFYPMRADFTRQRYFSEEFASYLMTGRPLLAHRDLSNSIGALMRPRDRQWLSARTHDTRINQDREARAYLDWMSEQQFRAMYDARAGLVRACKEADGDWAAFGNAVLSFDPNEWRDGLLMRCWHLRDVVWTENHALKINQVHHKKMLSARDHNRLYPKSGIAAIATKMKDDPDAESACRRIVIPSDEYDLDVKNRDRFPFVVIDVDVENDAVLAEVPRRSTGYVIPRWATISGSQYAYAPSAVYGLPDSRMLQMIALTMLEAGQKATDPPMVAVTEAIQGGVNIGAGMTSWVDADYDERTGQALRPLEMRFDGIRYGAEREERVEGTLDATWFLNQIRMPQVTKEMTAYEASKLYEEFSRNALPLLDPVEVDYNGGMCSAAYDELQALINPATGVPYFGSPYDVPQILRGQELRWEFDTPLKAAAEQALVFSYQATVETVAKGMSIDKNVALEVDFGSATRDAVVGTGGARWLRKPEVVAQMKQAAAQQQEQMQKSAMMSQGADNAGKLASAVKTAAEAHGTLKDNGAI